MQNLYTQDQVTNRPVEINKVLRNTYSLLAMTLVVSAIAAGVSMYVGIGRMPALVMTFAAIGLLWFVLPRTANSSKGLGVVFLFVSLMGAGLGPMLTYYLALPSGGTIVMQALGSTALIFFALSGYVLTTGKDFSFMGGFLMTGLIVALLSGVGMMLAGFFGYQISGFALGLNALIVLLMSGFILYDTSRIIHGGETNYLLATVSLYLNILNLFTSLLHLIGAFSGDD